jgi:hypothetical protein
MTAETQTLRDALYVRIDSPRKPMRRPVGAAACTDG